MGSEKGFTLIELLTVILIIGILAAIGLAGFQVYRGSAAYAVSEYTIHGARNAFEASLNNVDNPPAAVPLTVQTTQGPILNGLAKDLLPGMQIPKNVKFQVMYDPTCTTGACQTEYIEVSHCFAQQHVAFVRFGDGLDLFTDRVNGGGCT